MFLGFLSTLQSLCYLVEIHLHRYVFLVIRYKTGLLIMMDGKTTPLMDVKATVLQDCSVDYSWYEG